MFPKFFSIYKSHTQSSSGAESSSRDVRPKAGILKRVTQIYWVFVLVIVAWTFWPDEPKKPAPALVAQPSKPAAPKPTAPVQEPTPKPEPVPAPTSTPAPKPQPEPEPELDPTDRFGLLDSKAVHILGSMSMGNKAIFVFEISDGQRRLFQVDSGALERSGYTVQVIDTCLVQVIAPSGKPRAVICDAPNGSTYDARRPLVIDRKTGESSWDKGSYQPYRAAAASGSL